MAASFLEEYGKKILFLKTTDDRIYHGRIEGMVDGVIQFRDRFGQLVLVHPSKIARLEVYHE